MCRGLSTRGTGSIIKFKQRVIKRPLIKQQHWRLELISELKHDQSELFKFLRWLIQQPIRLERQASERDWPHGS